MQKKTLDHYFPILVDMRKMNVLVIGGGKISTRKVVNLLEFNNAVSVLSPVFSDELLKLEKEKRITLIYKEYSKGDIGGFNFVFCSTGKLEVDEKVYAECIEKGVLLNVADVPELCNFIIPATVKRGALTISIGSQGKAPFFVRGMRRKLSLLYGEEYADILEIAAGLRTEMIKSGIYGNEKIREKIFDEFLKIDFASIIKSEGINSAMRTALALLENIN